MNSASTICADHVWLTTAYAVGPWMVVIPVSALLILIFGLLPFIRTPANLKWLGLVVVANGLLVAVSSRTGFEVGLFHGLFLVPLQISLISLRLSKIYDSQGSKRSARLFVFVHLAQYPVIAVSAVTFINIAYQLATCTS